MMNGDVRVPNGHKAQLVRNGFVQKNHRSQNESVESAGLSAPIAPPLNIPPSEQFFNWPRTVLKMKKETTLNSNFNISACLLSRSGNCVSIRFTFHEFDNLEDVVDASFSDQVESVGIKFFIEGNRDDVIVAEVQGKY